MMLGSKGINWFSDDCGKTIWALNQGKPIYSFQFHPIQREWGLAASWTVCDGLESDSCELYKELFYTKDLGLHWTLVTPYVVEFSWAQAGLVPDIQTGIPDDRVYVVYIPDASGHQRTEEWTGMVNFVKSDDYFQTTTTLVERGNTFKSRGKFVVVGQMNGEETGEVQLLVSNEKNIEEFNPAELPAQHIIDKNFMLLDSSDDNSLFVHVKPLPDAIDFGHVYVSDSSGTRFTVSLLRNIRGVKGICDFDKAAGLEGIFIANVVSHTDTSSSSQQNTPKKHQKPAKVAVSFHKSVISFDKGNIWSPLAPPSVDSLGKAVPCDDPPCSLHLHSYSSDLFAPVYSSPTALGLVIGTGNIGGYLNTRADQVNTYMSRDGGLTWYEVKKGSYVYEIGDHGAVIVMASDSQATDTVYYSWDEGLTWKSVVFTDAPVEVESILIEPGAVSLRFVVVGSRPGKGIAVGIDFSSLDKPPCRNPDLPGTPDSDYEWWSPSDGQSPVKCLMGRSTTYTRRKRDTECVNGEQFERAAHVESCPCTDSDFECDVGYIRKATQCTPILTFEHTVDQCLPGETFYPVTTGYRRVAGDLCSGGVEDKYSPGKAPCKSSMFHSMGRTVLVLLLVAGLVSFLCRHMHCFQWLQRKLDGSGYTRNFTEEPDTVE